MEQNFGTWKLINNFEWLYLSNIKNSLVLIKYIMDFYESDRDIYIDSIKINIFYNV